MFNTTIIFLDSPSTKKGRVAKLLLLVTIDLIAILGNSLFLLAVCSRRTLRHQSRTYLYFSYVSLTSLVTSICVIPFPIVTFLYERWALGPGLCYFNAFMTTFCLTSCVYSITVLSFHKYISVVLPMRCRSDQKRTVFHCVLSFFLSLLVTVSLFVESRVYFNQSTGLCALHFVERKTLYTMVIVCSCYAVPTVINISLYIQIFRALRKHSRRLQFNTFYNPASVRAQRQTVKTMYMTFGSFIVGWTPFFVYAILFLTEKVEPQSNLLVVAYIFGFASSAANPLIFIFRNMRLKSSWSSIYKKKQIPKVKLISTVSRYGFSGSSESFPPPPPAVAAYCNTATNHSVIDDESNKNGSIDVCRHDDNSSVSGSGSAGGTFLRTSTNVFNYTSNSSFDTSNRKTFKTNETKM